jgi:hypothetical protein
MLDLGMVSLRRRVTCQNGLFGIWKDLPGGPIRLILDARPCNECFTPCPPVALPHPSRLGELSLAPHESLWIGGLDLENYYHHLRVPDWMVPYFGLPAVRVADLGLDDAALSKLGLTRQSKVYPAMLTLPMGFSHAVPLAQAVHEHALSSRSLLASSVPVATAPSLAGTREAHMVYIDDLNAFKVGSRHAPPPSLAAELDAAAGALGECGLPENRKKRVAPCTAAKVLGVFVDGDVGRLHPHPESLDRLIGATRALVRGPPPTTAQLRRVVGHWTWQLLIRRCSLSIFGVVYHYIRSPPSDRKRLWPAVVRELRLAIDLSPLIYTDLRAAMAPCVRAFDASNKGHASVYLPLAPTEAAALSSLLSGRGRAVVPGSAFHQVPGWRSHKWKVARCGTWRWTEHINLTEMRALLNSLDAHARRIDRRDTRLLVFGDSAVVVSASAKGRSGSPSLLGLMRKSAAIQMAFGLFPTIHHIPSADNPADGPSRGRPVWSDG